MWWTGHYDKNGRGFNSRWELDGVATRRGTGQRLRLCSAFQFPMGIRRSCYTRSFLACSIPRQSFNSRWELDGVATGGTKYSATLSSQK